MVRAEHIYKKYGKQDVLCDVNLEIGRGEIVGLLGPNGAGKSTMMKIIIGLIAPNSGTIQAPWHIGYLPEQNPLYEEMYVREYLLFMRRVMEKRAGENGNFKEEVEKLIEKVGLQSEAHKKIGQLSKGYRQRVGLAQALLGNPDLLILDEPTTGLDPNQLVEIRQLIREIGKERTVILSTHILQEVAQMCTRVVILNKGKIGLDKAIGEIDNLADTFQNITTQNEK